MIPSSTCSITWETIKFEGSPSSIATNGSSASFRSVTYHSRADVRRPARRCKRSRSRHTDRSGTSMRAGVVIAVLIAVALATAVALRYGARRLDGVVAETVERYGRAVTGTDVDVGGVDLALTAGRAELSDITIDNPAGYETDYAVHVDRANVALDVGSVADDVPVVEELTLDGAIIHVEQREAATNLTDIQRHA